MTGMPLTRGLVRSAALASDGARFLVALERERGETSDLLGLFVDASR